MLPGLPIQEQLVFTVQPEPFDSAPIKESTRDLPLRIRTVSICHLISQAQKRNKPRGGFCHTMEGSLVKLAV